MGEEGLKVKKKKRKMLEYCYYGIFKTIHTRTRENNNNDNGNNNNNNKSQ